MVASNLVKQLLWHALGVFLCSAFIITSACAQQIHHSDVQTLPDNGEIPVIVVLKSSPKASQERQAQGGWLNLQDYISQVQEEFTKEQGWVNFNELVKFKHVPAVAKSVSEKELQRLQQSQLVQGVYADRFNTPALLNSHRTIGLNGIPDYSHQGEGYAVAIIDSGVESSHPFFQQRVIDGACFSFNGSCPGKQKRAFGVSAGQPCTGNAGCFHGTHVAGIVAGFQAQLSGVAPQANLLTLNVFSIAGQRMGSRDSDIMQALEWVYEHAEKHNVAAVNMSLGGGQFSHTCDDAPIKRFIDLLAQKNVVTVIASGNERYTNAVASPACISTALTVGSTDPDGNISSFSNSYAELDVVAPGGEITSSGLQGRYITSSGTSMAAPQVAGAIALLRSAFPDASAKQLMLAVKQGKAVTDPRNGLQTVALYVPYALEYLEQIMVAPAPGGNRSEPPGKQPACRANVDGIIVEDMTEHCQSAGGNIQW